MIESTDYYFIDKEDNDEYISQKRLSYQISFIFGLGLGMFFATVINRTIITSIITYQAVKFFSIFLIFVSFILLLIYRIERKD